MKTMTAVLLTLAFLVPFSAHALEVSVQVGGGSMIIPAKGYDPFSQDDNFAIGSLAVGARPFGRGPLKGLGFEIGYAGGSAADRAWGVFDTSLTLNVFDFGASYRYGRLDWFAPYARLLGSVAWADVSVKNNVYGNLDDSAAVFGGTAVIGFELVTPRAWMHGDDDDGSWWKPDNFGVYVEAGYGQYGPLTFSRASAPPITLDDVHKTEQPVAGPALGRLSLSGPTIRAGFVANF